MDRQEKAQQVGAKLRELRDIRPKTGVAKACGLSYSALCKFESGLRLPRKESLEKLAKYYGVSPDDIFSP